MSLAAAFEQLLAVLDRLELPYCIGGSIASGSHGVPRQTKDIDIIADFRNVDIQEFCRSLQGDFYVDPQFAADALRRGRAFNAIHMKSAFKFDFFPASSAGFSQSELARKRYIISTIPGLENIEFPISSPEDTVLAKLLWFRQGGEVSENQWHDILGVLKVQSTSLDMVYMADWAARLGISDLLERALRSSK
jgi:hypothetical protein